VDSAASEVAEFAAILKREGIDGLITAWNRKVELLKATVAKSFGEPLINRRQQIARLTDAVPVACPVFGNISQI
jgi:hypothetical protein